MVYYELYVDEASRFKWLFLLKSKSETLDNFKKFHVYAERQFGRKIKTIMTDNAQEYLAKALTVFCSSVGIEQLYTNVCSPEENCIAEQPNNVLMNKVRCLLQDTGLDYQYWGEALNYVVCTENRSPNKALGGPQVVEDPEDADDIDDQPEQSPPRHQVTFTDDVTIRNSPSANPAQVESPHPEDPTSADDEEGSMSDSDVQVPQPGSLEAISGGFHQNYSVQVVNGTPVSFADIEKSPNRLKWLKATQVEYDSLIENGTWTLTDLPPGREALKCKWLWRMKFDADGKFTKYKARLVLKGYMQQYGIDYLEIFAPLLRMNALRLLLCLVAHHAWKIRQ
ncbi:hypothetical protein AeMF1_015388, partial [Aphanomyces euteiches]